MGRKSTKNTLIKVNNIVYIIIYYIIII